MCNPLTLASLASLDAHLWPFCVYLPKGHDLFLHPFCCHSSKLQARACHTSWSSRLAARRSPFPGARQSLPVVGHAHGTAPGMSTSAGRTAYRSNMTTTTCTGRVLGTGSTSKWYMQCSRRLLAPGQGLLPALRRQPGQAPPKLIPSRAREHTRGVHTHRWRAVSILDEYDLAPRTASWV